MDDSQLLRYSRQILLPQIGIDGQQKLLAARVLVIGVGGLGSPVATYLAASGVGHLVLVDHDSVELTNLQRQPIHNTGTLGLPKVESAQQAIAALNPEVQFIAAPDAHAGRTTRQVLLQRGWQAGELNHRETISTI